MEWRSVGVLSRCGRWEERGLVAEIVGVGRWLVARRGWKEGGEGGRGKGEGRREEGGAIAAPGLFEGHGG